MVSTDSKASQSQQELQLERLANLLLLEARVRESSNEVELGFTVVNDTLSLINGATALLWRNSPGGNTDLKDLFAVSASPLPEKHSPFSKWAKQYSQVLAELYPDTQTIVDNSKLPEQLLLDAKSLIAPNAVWLPICYGDNNLGFLAIFRSVAWTEAELRILQQWCATIAHAWNALQKSDRNILGPIALIGRKPLVAGMLVLVFLCLLLPVRLSVLAPAELKSGESFVVRSPVQGVVDILHVNSNVPVQEGQLLVSLDDTALGTELEVAEQELEIARAEFRQSSQAAAFSDEASASLQVQRITLEKIIARVNYLNDLLSRTKITSPQSATVIVEDEDEFIGRPVQLGERLLTLVDEDNLELELWLPVGDDIELLAGSSVNFFPNVAPDRVYSGELLSLNYEAQLSPLGTLAYRARASVSLPEGAFSRIGMRGTGKLFGKQVSLFYYLFRRPISFVRQLVGL